MKKALDDYDKGALTLAKAARYSNHTLKMDYKKNDSVQWVFITMCPKANRLRNVIMYDDERQLSEYGIDWTTIVDKWIHRKLKLVWAKHFDGIWRR